MSNIIAGIGGRGAAATTAITVALILMMASSLPAILSTTQEAFAAPISNKDCKDIQFRPFGNAFASYSDKTVTIGTSQHEYSVKTDYLKVEDYFVGYTYWKNVGAEDPQGRVLLPGGETITITLQTSDGVSRSGGHVFLYKHKVSDCQILLGQVPASDKIDLRIVRVEGDREPDDFKVTVQVPDASDVVGEHFTKLGIQFKYNDEVHGYHLISNRVQVR